MENVLPGSQFYVQALEKEVALLLCKLCIEESQVAYWKDLYVKLYEKTELGEAE
jgi:hypothetical protein